jgi:CheY-like chemotaxis protein
MTTTTKKQIGNLLVEAGIISLKTLERSLEAQKGSGKRLGSLLREMGIVTEEEVLLALARQCNLRVIKSFAQQTFDKELLDLVPARLALEKLLFPLKAYRKMLAVATLDPFDRDTFELLEQRTGMEIHPVLATRENLIAAIRRHYPVGRWAVGGRQNIVVIDPSPMVAVLLRSPLEKEGYEVSVCHDGIEALKIVYACPPNLIICDQAISRLDSYMFLYALKSHPATMNIPVILMSTKYSKEEEHRALKAGFFDIIVKPVMPVRVLVSVKKALAMADGKARTTVPGLFRETVHISPPSRSTREISGSRY